MTHELALLAALFKPEMRCTWKSPEKAAENFLSDNSSTPGGTLLYQRNHSSSFDEIIVYAYDAVRKRYVRTQLSNNGQAAAAVSSGPVNGVWRFTQLSVEGQTDPVIFWKRTAGESSDWYDKVAGRGVCQ